MAKRTADKELTDRNWDQEEESEEAGTFSVASEDVLKNRAIKKAKRRNLLAESEGGGIFKGFSGLVSSTGSTGFGGFGNGSGFKPLHGLNNGNNLSSSKSSPSSATDVNNPIGSFLSNGPPPNPLAKGEIGTKTNGVNQINSGDKVGSSEYNRQLAALNCSVRDWITKHVNENPLCDLTPIFKDYEKHLTSIEQKYGSSSDSGSESDTNSKRPEMQSVNTFGVCKTPQGTTPSSLFSSVKNKDIIPVTSEKKSETAMGNSGNLNLLFGKKIENSPLAGFSFGGGTSGSLFGKDVNQEKIVAPTFSFTASVEKKEEIKGSEYKDTRIHSKNDKEAVKKGMFFSTRSALVRSGVRSKSEDD